MRLVTEQGYRQTEAARDLGIERGLFGRWPNDFQPEMSKVDPSHESELRLIQ
jgi:transposase-like protein